MLYLKDTYLLHQEVALAYVVAWLRFVAIIPWLQDSTGCPQD